MKPVARWSSTEFRSVRDVFTLGANVLQVVGVGLLVKASFGLVRGWWDACWGPQQATELCS